MGCTFSDHRNLDRSHVLASVWCAVYPIHAHEQRLDVRRLFLSGNAGDSVQLELNLAYFLPAFPMLIATLTVVPKLDRYVGHLRGLGSRISVCMFALAMFMFVFPTAVAAHGKAWVMACSALIGIFGGLAYGSMFALVSGACWCTMLS